MRPAGFFRNIRLGLAAPAAAMPEPESHNCDLFAVIGASFI
jgi:hypothetical protein